LNRVKVLAALADYYRSEKAEASELAEMARDGVQDPYSLERLLRETEVVPLDFYHRRADAVAREILGCVLLNGETAGMIVETEAYLGGEDLAAHAAGGITQRTKVLFGPPGRAYVYLSYGIHECLNIVADQDGVPGCVLIRALEPLCGLAEMYRRRKWNGSPVGLANGPGKVGQALAITRAQYGERLASPRFAVRRWLNPPVFEVEKTPRIGISKCVDWPLRFFWSEHPCVSKAGISKASRRIAGV